MQMSDIKGLPSAAQSEVDSFLLQVWKLLYKQLQQLCGARQLAYSKTGLVSVTHFQGLFCTAQEKWGTLSCFCVMCVNVSLFREPRLLLSVSYCLFNLLSRREAKGLEELTTNRPVPGPGSTILSRNCCLPTDPLLRVNSEWFGGTVFLGEQ